MEKLRNAIRRRYYISPLDLADASETNRLHSQFMGFLFFLFGILTLSFVMVLHRNSLDDYLVEFIYYGVSAGITGLACLVSVKVRDVEREKAYIYKNIPFYMVFFWGIGAGSYNFYFLGQPFNGVITYILTFSIVLGIFSIAPRYFLIALIAGISPMLPGIYKNFKITGLMDTILVVIVMFGLVLYKRASEKRYITLLKKQKSNLEAKTFGNFTLLFDNKVVKFSRTKSLELMAYLIYKNGSSVQTKELINLLWGEHADSASYGANLRNLISDIKHTFAELGIQTFFITEYNNFRINPEIIKCDYYDFLSGDSAATKNFAGDFMSQFSWAEDAAAFIERKVLK